MHRPTQPLFDFPAAQPARPVRSMIPQACASFFESIVLLAQIERWRQHSSGCSIASCVDLVVTATVITLWHISKGRAGSLGITSLLC